uniref:Uncharacterized protein n=1 Tax=Caenorhabditis japonica TaxID=281687 RepID=A0A8R1IN40_CAEJA
MDKLRSAAPLTQSKYRLNRALNATQYMSQASDGAQALDLVQIRNDFPWRVKQIPSLLNVKVLLGQTGSTI